MENKKSRWIRWQQGQAMSEYWVTIPGSIIIMIAAAALVQFIISGFTATVTGLKQPGGLPPCNDNQPEQKKEGPEFAQLDCYSVQLVARSYDEVTKRTTVGYRITATCGDKIPDACTPPSDPADVKTTICHKAGKANSPANSVVLSLPQSALSAHLDEHGTPLAGHEQDFIIQSQDDLNRCFEDNKGQGGTKGGSGNRQAIEYWTLGLPSNVTDKIVSVSETYSKGNGVKFDSYSTCNNYKDTGLGVCHIAGRAEDPSNWILMENMPLSAYGGHIDEHGTPTAGHEQDFVIQSEADRQRCLAGPTNGNGNGKKTQNSVLMLTGDPLSSPAQATADSRTVLVTMNGYFNWGIVDLGITTSTTTSMGQITAPIEQTTPPEDNKKCDASK